MGKIIELDEVLANKIAAGEVVERPASVVKELVENAIDAGSTRIVVTIEESGLRKIEVIDNGSGIEKEDVPLALRRHATSKLKDASQLFKIRTLGFRGEAMPSIASVSELTVETSVAEEESGTRLVAKASEIMSLEPIAKREGTKVSVANLFYNTPARLKYIKSLQAELSHIIDVMNRQALAQPEISFTLVNEGREVLKTAGNGDLRQVIASVYGLQTAKKVRKITASDLDFEVEGYVSLPELTRANRNYISLFINGRYIKNFLLNRAIIEGYGSKLMVGRFPLAVIAIKIDPQLADVNVHPTKQEVRLSKEKELMQLLTAAIRETLSEETLIPDALENLSGQTKIKAEPAPVIEYDNQKQDFYKRETEIPVVREESAPLPIVQVQELFEASEPEKVENNKTFPELTFLAQLHATYLLCQAEDGMYIVDQHAAQERFRYEYWREKIGEVSMDQQILLAPLLFDLPKNDFLTILERKAELEPAGIFLEEYGESQLILREHPTWLKESDIESSVYEMIDQLLAQKTVSVKTFREDLAIMIACKGAIKAHDLLDEAGAKRILSDLATCENPYNCPHGRPTLVHFSSADMEKMFRRIMQTHLSRAASWKNFD